MKGFLYCSVICELFKKQRKIVENLLAPSAFFRRTFFSSPPTTTNYIIVIDSNNRKKAIKPVVSLVDTTDMQKLF